MRLTDTAVEFTEMEGDLSKHFLRRMQQLIADTVDTGLRGGLDRTGAHGIVIMMLIDLTADALTKGVNMTPQQIGEVMRDRAAYMTRLDAIKKRKGAKR